MQLITASGRLIDLTRMGPNDICLPDIAASLSKLCRFGGHTREFYSVAQHSVLVANNLPQHLQLAGLLHDAAEAYLCDLPRPVKELLPSYRQLEEKVWHQIAAVLHIPTLEDPLIHTIDLRACKTEMALLMPGNSRLLNVTDLDILPGLAKALSHEKAHRLFLETYYRIVGRRK